MTTFLKRFAVNKEGEAPIQCLHDMRQAPGESLKIFLSCFIDEMMYPCNNHAKCEMNQNAQVSSHRQFIKYMTCIMWKLHQFNEFMNEISQQFSLHNHYKACINLLIPYSFNSSKMKTCNHGLLQSKEMGEIVNHYLDVL